LSPPVAKVEVVVRHIEKKIFGRESDLYSKLKESEGGRKKERYKERKRERENKKII
jgi:hypothetical protein